MRDPKRIPKILAKVQAYWEKNPDCRLGQLVSNLAGAEDVFYIEDGNLEKNLKKNLAQYRVSEPAKKAGGHK